MQICDFLTQLHVAHPMLRAYRTHRCQCQQYSLTQYHLSLPVIVISGIEWDTTTVIMIILILQGVSQTCIDQYNKHGCDLVKLTLSVTWCGVASDTTTKEISTTNTKNLNNWICLCHKVVKCIWFQFCYGNVSSTAVGNLIFCYTRKRQIIVFPSVPKILSPRNYHCQFISTGPPSLSSCLCYAFDLLYCDTRIHYPRVGWCVAGSWATFFLVLYSWSIFKVSTSNCLLVQEEV